MAELAAALARRRSLVEPPADATAPAVTAEVTLDDLEAMQQVERQKRHFELARICTAMQGAPARFPDVYPLQDDSRFYMQALIDNIDEICACSNPSLAVEVGCGAAPSAALLSRLLPATATFAVDISTSALCAAEALMSHAPLHLARMDLLAAFRSGMVDVLLFLPPYVPTSEDALLAQQVAAAAADQPVESLAAAAWNFGGGPSGLALLERFVAEELHRVLSDDGIAFILTPDTDESPRMVERASCGALTATVAARHRDERQALCILRVEKSGVG